MTIKLSWLEVILLAAPFVVLAIYWNELPARVPMHWNLRGEIDAWGAKGIGLFMLPLLLVVWVIFYSWHHSRTHASPRST